jgi:hypothetical protein
VRFKKRPKPPRPDFPKLVAIPGSVEEVRELLPSIQASDPDAALVDAAGRGVYVRVNNEIAETKARLYGERRQFPLA